MFIFLSISYLLSNKFPDIWSYETLYFSVIYFLTLPFILGIEIPKKKIIYPLYFLAGSIFLVYQELGFNNNYIDTDFDTDTSYDEGIYISPSFLGNYKFTIIDDQKNIKEM